MHQDQATDDRVERSGRWRRGGVALDERHVGHAGLGGPPDGERYAARIDLDTDHGAGCSHHLGREQGDTTGAAPDVEHAHPLAEARPLEQRTGHGSEELILEHQSMALGIRASQDVRVGERLLMHVTHDGPTSEASARRRAWPSVGRRSILEVWNSCWSGSRGSFSVGW